jgi:hypothetical protein
MNFGSGFGLPTENLDAKKSVELLTRQLRRVER